MGNIMADKVRVKITREPKVYDTNAGKKLATAGGQIGFFDKKKNEWTNEWVTLKCFGSLAETLGQCHKGDTILVDGRVMLSSYDKDGERRKSWDIWLDDISLPESAQGRQMQSSDDMDEVPF